MITLYQFPFSHFCEKARWALDFKGVSYACKNLVPGPHLKVTKKLAPRTCVPILVHDGSVVQDSSAIITFLDEKHPGRSLTPCDGALAKEALEWEEYFDEEIGVPLRLWFYFHTLPDRSRAQRFLLEGAPWYGRPLMALIYPGVRDAMRRAMNINAESAKKAEARLLKALDRLDGAVQGRRFLVGDCFSRADLTACSLLRTYCASGKSNTELEIAFPEEIRESHNRDASRPFFNWVADMYKNHRQA
jgi:glutathione S-transferase